jgi:hypothetical protein
VTTRMALPLLLLTALVGPLQLHGQEARSVEGTVRGAFEGSVRPLPFSVVELWGPGFRRSVLADSAGVYRLAGVPPGALRLRASYAGHSPVTVDVLVPASGTLFVDLELPGQPVRLPPVDVTTDVRLDEPEGRAPPESGQGVDRFEAAALETGAGLAESGLADAVRALGGNDPGDASDVLFMRGSTTDLKLVLLDGAPVFTPFHVAGLLRSFEPEVLGRADLHVGGAPARYDGGLTYILDLHTRRPPRDATHVSGSVDLLSAATALETPLGSRAGAVMSARRLHDLGEAPLGASPYGYADLLTGLEVRPAEGHLLRATGFWNRESVLLDLPGTAGVSAARAPEEAWWSNRALSASYVARMGRTFLEATVAGSGYDAALPLQAAPTQDDPQPIPVLAEANNERLRSGVEAAHPTSWGVLRSGISWEDVRVSYAVTSMDGGAGGTRIMASSSRFGGYVDASGTLGPGLTLRAGTRAEHFSGDGLLRLAPRVALSWEVAPAALLTLAAGRYHQLARATDVAVERSLGDVAADPEPTPGDLLPVATADHLVVALDQNLGERVRLGLSGFAKSYHGLSTAPGEVIRSSGVDLRVRRQSDRSSAWVGYGLTWYWSDADLSGSTSQFTGRQLLTAGWSGPLGDVLGGDVRLAFGAGLPYTSVPFRAAEAMAEDNLPATEGVLGQTPPLPGGLDEDFLRLDVEVHGTFHMDWGSRTVEIRPYLRILNALDRRDALFYAFQPWRSDELTPLAERPLVPVVGIAWRF